MEPLISVLVPMYNVEDYITRCVNSITSQTYKNLEIVLLDDGSKDGTYKVAQELAKKDKRIKLLQKPNEANISKTRNYLLDHFSGKYFVFVDSDDMIKPNYVEKLYSTMVATGADVVCCRSHMQKKHHEKKMQKKSKIKVFQGDEIVPHMILNRGIRIVLWNKIYKTSMLKDIRFRTDVRFGEDVIFEIDFLRHCKTVVTINDRLYYYTLRPGSEIHQKYCEKNETFIDMLAKMADEEKDENIENAIRAWLCFSSVGFAFLARHDKKKNAESIKKLKILGHLNKKCLLKHKKSLWWQRLIVRLGFLTWCRKPKQLKEKSGE